MRVSFGILYLLISFTCPLSAAEYPGPANAKQANNPEQKLAQEIRVLILEVQDAYGSPCWIYRSNAAVLDALVLAACEYAALKKKFRRV